MSTIFVMYGSLVGFLCRLLLLCRLVGYCCHVGSSVFFTCIPTHVATSVVGLVGAGAKLADVVLLLLSLSCGLSLLIVVDDSSNVVLFFLLLSLFANFIIDDVS